MALYAFDGTWNEDEEDNEKNTNVWKFCTALPEDMNVFYLEGVGTRGPLIGKLIGGLTGAGGRSRLDEALKKVDEYFSTGDRIIDIIGFSRGAALALHFANQINKKKDGAEIRFLGLWDTVASFGVPGNRINLGWDLTLPDNVKKCCHAMALDERRGNFPLTRIKAPPGGLSIEGRVQEVWFRGVHSDVGGGQCPGLSSITLSWMLRRAKDNGLPVVEEKLRHHESLCDPSAPISKNFDPKLDPPRKIRTNDAVHASVQPRGRAGGKEHNDPPQDVVIVEG